VQKRKCSLIVVLTLSALACLKVDRAFGFSSERRSRSDKNIAAIGHRNIAGEKNGNWYSIEREKELGQQFSAETERSFKVLEDCAITDYVARIADNVAKNSDAQIPITVRLLDSEQVRAFTLPGGYQYVTRGLLLQLENEDELASVLARGIAHTALRSATRLMTREEFAKIGAIPLIYVGSGVPPNGTSDAAVPLTMLSFGRRFELDADYFGVQYVYKAGYDPESFVHFVQRIWPANGTPAQAFGPFPPTPDRLKALRKEIADLLPNQDGKTGSTPEFAGFRERLRAWRPEGPVRTPIGEIPLPCE
jgi:beta-barrel assembly-enhancing protease